MNKTVEYFDFLETAQNEIEKLLGITRVDKQINRLREEYQDYPESAISNTRRLAEAFVKGLTSKEGLDMPKDFSRLINQLKSKGIIDKDVSEILHEIRDIGNKGVHSDGVTAAQAEQLIMSFELVLRVHVTPNLTMETAKTYAYPGDLLIISYHAFDRKIIYIQKNPETDPRKIGDASVPDDPEGDFRKNSEYMREHAAKRIKRYMTTAGLRFDLEWTELAVNKSHRVFRDHDVHKVLLRSGIKNTGAGREWFNIDLDTAKQAIAAVKEGRSHLSLTIKDEKISIQLRKEQLEAIRKTKKVFKKSQTMLWNAKMRFGKTLTALQLIKEQGYKKVLIMTHRPIVKDGWRDDFFKIGLDKENYIYGSTTKGASIDELVNNDTPFIYFASIQDLRGSNWAGGSFNKNQEFLQIDWDFMIIDEAHEGNETDLARNVKEKLINKNTKVLELSGTPFNLMDKYDDDEVFTWDYTMEQRAKSEWDEQANGANPYDGLPKVNMYTFDMPNKDDFVDAFKNFNFKAFFATNDDGEFLHKAAINNFLNVITTESATTNFPFSTELFRNRLRHTLWLLPGVKEANALEQVLNEHPIFKEYSIVNVVKTGDDTGEATENDLELVRAAITGNPSKTRTITLTVRKLTTGVNVPEWAGVMFLNNTESPTTYLQAAFRAQTPYNHESMGIKRNCYVFDFAPDRALKILTESIGLTSKKGKINSIEQRDKLGELLNFLPVLGFSTNRMQKFSVDEMMSQIKKVHAEKAVRSGFEDDSLYNDNLLTLEQTELDDFDGLKAIVGSTEKSKSEHFVQIAENGFTHEEREEAEKAERKPKKERSDKEVELAEKLKKAKDQRKIMMSILRGISIRIPMMIYGMDVELTRDIGLDDFVKLVDEKSWEEFMPKGVSKARFKKFAKYYDADVFIEAGRIIRNRAKSYDELEPITRAEKIALLFGMFKNPDKETVLTPWRVVNMQMVRAFGGYNFFDDAFENTTVEGEGIYTTQSKILDINTKEGLHSLFVAISIFEREMRRQAKKNKRFNPANIWATVLKNNIYAIAKTPMAVTITKRTLCGYNDKLQTNIAHIEDLVQTMKTNRGGIQNAAGQIREVFDKVKFDAVVGNPPYQDTTTGNSTQMPPIYHLFIELAKEMSNKFCLIHPARFLFNAGATPNEWNRQMLTDTHFKVLHYEQDSSKVFPNTDIKGGVAITYRDVDSDFEAVDVFTNFSELNSILKKTEPHLCEGVFSEIVYNRGLYRYSDEIYELYPKEMKAISDRRLASNAFSKLPELFLDSKPEGGEFFAIYGREESERKYKWFDGRFLNRPENLYRYKVILPKANGSGAIGEVLSTPLIGQPLIGHTETFISIGSFETGLEAEACLKYVQSKFARALLGVLKITQDNTKETWAKVPLQNFTTASDIDWTKTVAEIDRQLYRKYNLDSIEIDFIEEKVKAME